MNEPPVSGLQLRAGRLGRGVDQSDIARAARVSRRTVGALERDGNVQPNHRSALLDAYRALGLEFERRDDGSQAVVFAPTRPPGS